jgi:hypothetical protein
MKQIIYNKNTINKTKKYITKKYLKKRIKTSLSVNNNESSSYHSTITEQTCFCLFLIKRKQKSIHKKQKQKAKIVNKNE